MKNRKGKIIRPGNKKPFSKTTLAEVDRRITEVELMLRKGPILKSQLVQRIKDRFGVEWRQAEVYITRAREKLLLRLAESKSYHRANSLAFYEGIITNGFAMNAERIRAQERIDKLLGLEAPSQAVVEHTGDMALNVDINDLALDLPTRKKLLQAIRQKKPESVQSNNGNGKH